MRVVLCAVTGLRNRGVEALVVTTIEQLRKRRERVAVDVLSETPDYDEMRLAPWDVRVHDVRPLQRTMANRLRRSVAELVNDLVPRVRPGAALGSTRGYDAAKRVIAEAAAVVALGGDVFSSTYGAAFLRSQLHPLELAVSLGVPAFFSAQSIGPFASDADRDAWLAVARRAALVSVRERTSLAYVEALGVPRDKVKLTSDPAFLLEPDAHGDALLRHYGIARERPLIVLAPSHAICGWAGADREAHAAALVAVAKWALDDVGAQLLVVPHVQGVYAELIDTWLATELVRRMDYDPRVKVAAGEHGAAEYKAMIARGDLVIAERMHAAIAGLSSGVATLCVGYSIKAKGIFESVLGEGSSAGWVVPIEDFNARAVDAARDAWNARTEMSARLVAARARVRADAGENFEAILARTRG